MIKNVKKEEVFKLLSERTEVYAISTLTDDLKNLLYEDVKSIVDWLKEDEYEYFIVEKEDRKSKGAVTVYG